MSFYIDYYYICQYYLQREVSYEKKSNWLHIDYCFSVLLFTPCVSSEAAAKPGKAVISSVTLNKSNQPVIKWGKVDGATGYRVYRKTQTDTKWVKATSTKKLTFTDKKVKVKEGSTVQYKVRAYTKNNAGKTVLGSYSKVKTVDMPQAKKKVKKTLSYPVELNETNFPDPDLRDYIAGLFWVAEKPKSLTEEQALSVTRIQVSGWYITSLKGIEYFPNLQRLVCDNNMLTEIDLSGNSNLTTLYCSNNELTVIDVSGSMLLEKLHCDSNNLTNLDISKNVALIELSCSANKITDLDLSKNVNLETLICSENPLKTFDLSKNVKLKELSCDFVSLGRLDLSPNTALVDVSCTRCALESIDITKNIALEELNCSYNLLSELDISNNNSLTSLKCGYNSLTSLDVTSCAELDYLDCENNGLTSLDVTKNAELCVLNCFSNKLSSLDVTKNAKLFRLYCLGNIFTSIDVSQNPRLEEIAKDGSVRFIE